MGGAPGGLVLQTRAEYYRATHAQRIAFLIAERVVTALVASGGQASTDGATTVRFQARHQLFPQVLRLVLCYVETRVDFRGCDPRELGHERYAKNDHLGLQNPYDL